MIAEEYQKFRSAGGLNTYLKDQPDDAIMVGAGYEPRTLSVAESLSATYRARKGLIYVNDEFLQIPNHSRTEEHLKKLGSLLSPKCETVKEIHGSWLKPQKQLTALRDAIAGAFTPDADIAITLDATTFTRETLLVATAIIEECYKNAKIRVAYVSPLNHGSWLSHGFREVRSVMGFPGIQRPSWPTLLVVLSGFEPDRTSQVIEEHEPTLVALGIADPPTKPEFLTRNLEEQKLILARQDVIQFKFPSVDLKGSRDSIWKIIEPYLAKYNVVIAPMSTKISTMAAYLVAKGHPEIQLTYCVPGEYNLNNYSDGANMIFVRQISHGA